MNENMGDICKRTTYAVVIILSFVVYKIKVILNSWQKDKTYTLLGPIVTIFKPVHSATQLIALESAK